MPGRYQINEKQRTSIQHWFDSVFSSQGGWKANNLHVDEIEGLQSIKREEWVQTSLALLNSMTQFRIPNSLLLFLHFDLQDFSRKPDLSSLSLKWLELHISEFTPPSFNCTSLQYYERFYIKKLTRCAPDNDMISFMDERRDFRFFYGSYFDEREEMFSGDVYIFCCE